VSDTPRRALRRSLRLRLAALAAALLALVAAAATLASALPSPLALLVPCAAFVLALFAGGALVERWLFTPLHALDETARSIAAGRAEARSRSVRTDELGELARSIDEMADRVEVARSAERELLANVSHELKTPLARLKVALELAAEGHEAGRKALEEAGHDIAELDAIVESILLAFRLERSDASAAFGLPASSLRTVSVRELIERAVQRFEGAHPEQRLELELADATILGDGVLLGRVLGNLLDNAWKYGHRPDLPVRVTARTEPGGVEIVVVDHGIGIDPADLPRIFEPFFRTDRSRARTRGGVGLGLTLSRRIVEAHGGTLSVASPSRGPDAPEGAGPGTSLRLRLPTLR
jgi:two-component system OmpR family sensor kinase